MSQGQLNSFFNLLNLVFKATDIGIALKRSLFDFHDVEEWINIVLHDPDDRHAPVVE
jgi:hypothetical protein